MLFNSFKFLLFFPIVTVIYFFIKKEKIKLIWLLIASYFFYMCWSPKYALLMLLSTFITYISGILISKSKSDVQKKLVLFFSLVSNLGILFCFKYLNFIIDNINLVFSKIGIDTVSNFNILLPVGISFYTFQALSYSMDVYRKDVEVEKSFIKYALFVSFFPQLVAGPIEKSKDFLQQFQREHKFNYKAFLDGFLLMLGGFLLKLIIADRAAIIVNSVYNNVTSYTGLTLILATFLFAIQIYCDFYSYSVIAKGSALILGYKLSDNFDRPYLATSIKNFWRKWHISLSTWFKEYLYFPLGGSKVKKIKIIRNILIVFITSGLWHGAAWTFIVWGFLHALYQIVGMVTENIRNVFLEKINLDKNSRLHKIIQVMITFVLVDFAWIFFRANNINDAIYVVKNILNFSNSLSISKLGLDIYNFILLFITIILLIIYELMSNKINLVNAINSKPLLIRWGIYVILIFSIIIFGIYGPGYDASQFIYFQF